MSRSKRYHIPGAFYHVMLRGNYGQDIFFSDSDRYFMCFLLQEGVEKYGHRIHAFCFMQNHIHLLIQVGEISLSKIMQNVAFRYSQKINYKHKKAGRLFQGRFKAILIDEGIYFKRLMRYIHLNPVRANITNSPEKYLWSSHNAYLNKNKIKWLTTEYGLLQFCLTIKEATSYYQSYVLEGESLEELEDLRKNFKDGQLLGDDNFLEQIREKSGIRFESPLSLEAIVKAACQEFQIHEKTLQSSSKAQKISFIRAIISTIANRHGKIPIVKIASYLNRDASRITHLISKLTLKSDISMELQLELEKVKQRAIEIAGSQA